MTEEKKKGEGVAVRIKRFCSTEDRPVTVTEMKELMAACREDDRRDNKPDGSTLKGLAAGIPN